MSLFPFSRIEALISPNLAITKLPAQNSQTDTLLFVNSGLNRFIDKKKRGVEASLFSDPLGARTQDPNIKSVVLYLLS